MNSLTVLLSCVVIVAVVNGAVLSLIAQYQMFYDECRSSTNTDPLEIEKIFYGEPITVEVLGDHLLCMYNKYNIGKDNGDIDKENLRKTLSVFNPSQEKNDLVVTNCSVKKGGATPQEVAVELVKCVRKYGSIQSPISKTLQKIF